MRKLQEWFDDLRGIQRFIVRVNAIALSMLWWLRGAETYNNNYYALGLVVFSFWMYLEFGRTKKVFTKEEERKKKVTKGWTIFISLVLSIMYVLFVYYLAN